MSRGRGRGAAGPLEAHALELAERWEAEAEGMARRGAEAAAACLRSCADDLRAHVDRFFRQSLTLEEAAEESGLAYSTLQQQVSRGEIPNAGRKGSPRILRRHLPRVAGRRARITGSSPEEPDLAGEVLLSRRGRR